ncbi:MAG: NAD(+) synthase [Lachnospiraceae bacterium]|nr:NAD(+) synthase [Lachnospiraceae bacterium]
MFDYYRVAAAVPDLKVADVEYNKIQIIKMINSASKENVNVVCFPELAITGYSCSDLFFQSNLLKASKAAITDIVSASKGLNMAIVIGAPLLLNNQLYNASIFIYNSKIYGINVKTFLPNYNEFYEKRWFSSADSLDISEVTSDTIYNTMDSYCICVGNNIIYNLSNKINIGIEICEDLWAPVTPSAWATLGGAELILNLSASNETIGKREYRTGLVKNKSVTLMCDYLYVSAGANESTTDIVFSGHSILAENGKLIAENKHIADNEYLMVKDIDLGKIKADRIKGKTYSDTKRIYGSSFKQRIVNISVCDDFGSNGDLYNINPHPFIPSTKSRRLERCSSIFDIQVGGLAKRLSVTGGKLVVGVSGGMDSTLALLVCAKTLKKLGRPMSDLIGITMPAFGTTDRTYNNSISLMKTLGATIEEINIKEACLQHYKDIKHDYNIKDVTFENVQARERTQVLMDYANKIGAIVVGTGDLSELALGWCTYNADQMSMYGVNASIPKTLVRWMIDSVIELNIFENSKEVLKDILDTPISPELLPPDENGNIVQKTEDNVGPYELHDFFLYYVMRYGYAPNKIFNMAEKAFENVYNRETILKWMKMFYRRFFNQQFKRSCMPDGVKVGSVCLSPRGDWRMPSDASAALWLSQIEKL